MNKVDVLRQIRFGERIAEEELDELEKYFVATDQWTRVFEGEVDVIYGAKGSGKSAIYALIDKRQNDLFDRGILVQGAENVRGATAFSEVFTEPPPSEKSFVDLWKLYFLILTASTLREYGITEKNSQALIAALEKANLLPASASLNQLFDRAKKLIWSYLFPEKESVEWTLALDPNSGAPIVTRKVNLAKANGNEERKVGIPLDDLLHLANRALENNNYSLWVLFDRLDVAFNDTPQLERNALRALFRMYNDFKAFDRIKLKIFVRDDIWDRVTEGGFAEASHITKTTTISWDYESLLNLFIRRLVANESFNSYLGIDPKEVSEDFEKQASVVEAIFPDKVETGNNPSTFKWMVTRVQDGTGKSAPRELIHLSEMIRQQQVRRLERGEDEAPDKALFERAVFKPALKEVGKVRYEQTFKAENPSLSAYTDKLKGQKAEQTTSTLQGIWGVDEGRASEIIDRLVKSGFFEKRIAPEKRSSQEEQADQERQVVNNETTYWVPFIYRDALELVQGKA